MILSTVLFLMPGQLDDEVQLFIQTYPGLSIEETDSRELLLRGEIHRLSDYEKISDFLVRHPQIENKTELSSQLLDSIGRRLRRELEKLGRRIVLKRKGRVFYVDSPSVDTALLERLRAIYPLVQPMRQTSTASKAAVEPTILLEVALIEVRKTAFERLGLRVQSPLTLEAQLGLAYHSGGSALSLSSGDSLRVFLDLAMQKGEARLHAKQSIVAQNGERGEFQAGGEFPIKIVHGMVSRVEFKQYGLILKFIPTLKTPKDVHLQIESEISEIDTGALVDGIPVISKKDLKTQLTTKVDQMIAIGGIVRSSQSSYTESIPGLSSIPILGRLFQSDDFKRHRSEAFIFVTARKLDNSWLPQFEL